jgi:hypothetical protein
MKITLFIIMLAFIAGCGLFQKTSKTSHTATQSSKSELEASQLVLKSGDKETRVFTYWNDSGFYQFQHIKERIDQAKLDKVATAESEQSKSAVVLKKADPIIKPIYIGLAVLLVVCFLLYKWQNMFKI